MPKPRRPATRRAPQHIDQKDNMSDSSYSELAQQTKNLAAYRGYREAAESRRDEAIAEEEENIRHETRRIEAAEERIRELVAELGLA